nr:PIN domain-containing protein [Halomarina oriensis]
MRALVGGGVAPLENHDEVETFVRRYGYPDLEAGHRPVFAGIDTNLLMWRPESLLSLDPSNGDERGRSPVNGYALSAGVKEELDFHFRHGESRRLVDAFGPEFDRLKGQPTSDNRQGLLGLYAYRQFMAERNVDVVPGEKGDRAIVDSYHDYHEEDRNRVVLFSNDHGFVDRAHECGLLAQHVSFPVDTRRKATVSWRDIEETLYLLTVVFGVLVLPKVTLYGAWEGKDGRDWQTETVDVDCRSPKYQRELKRRERIVTAFDAAM